MTDQSNVAELTKILNSPHPQKKIYHTLLRIHSEIIPSETKLKEFKEQDGVKSVVQFLSKPNEKILNISLGILASCCSDKDCCNKILSEGVENYLILILRSVNDDRIQYRCYKLISSLINHSNFCSTIVSNNLLQLMAPVLDGNPSLFTKVTAIKTVKRIWIASNLNDRKMVAKSNIIKSVIKHLSCDNVDVQKTVLKVVYCVSKTRSDIILKQAFQEDTLKNIISKTSEFPMLILPIINYLSVMKCFYFELAKAGTLEAVFSLIREINLESSDVENNTIVEMVLRSVQRLCIEPKCREKLCNIPDAFYILLNIIENSPKMKFKKYSTLILTSFIYDEFSLKRLILQRLIIVLAGYLQIIVNEEGTPHDSNEFKNESVNLLNSPTSSGRASPLSDCETMLTSPSPTSDRYGFSPAYSESSDYSPVYSPVMDESEGEDEIEEECEKLSIDDASSKADSPFIPDDDDNVKLATEEKIFNLLKQLTYIREPLYDFSIQKTWETFLNYLVLVRKSNSHVTTVLSSIAGNKFYFDHLLKSQFPLAVHKKLCRPVHADCPICAEMERCGIQILFRFLDVAESSYGHQIIRNELSQNSNQKYKMPLALMIPHIVKNSNQLEEYYLRYKLLDCIVESLNNDDDKYPLEEKIACLYSLAINLYVENPRTPCNLCKKCDVASLVKEATISFLLDDGSTVTANKSSLCEKSEFFEAMFRCGFKEAKQSTVPLKNITSDCLRALFRLLYSYCDCIVPRNVAVLLELIVQSDRFSIPALPEKLLHVTMNSRLNYSNCHLIYNWAKEHGSFLPSSSEWPICTDVIKYVLVDDDITFNHRVNSFKSLLKSKHRSSVLKDILEVIECRLKSKDNKTNKSKDSKTKSSSKFSCETASKKCKLT